MIFNTTVLWKYAIISGPYLSFSMQDVSNQDSIQIAFLSLQGHQDLRIVTVVMTPMFRHNIHIFGHDVMEH